jgi:uncharacterized protein YbjT (DUF2867 family)
MSAVMGATGNTGRKITQILLEAGEEVRVLGRSKTKLGEVQGKAAKVFTGDAADSSFLTQAFRAADPVYSLLPTDRRSRDYEGRQRQQGEAIATAIRQSGAPYIAIC